MIEILLAKEEDLPLLRGIELDAATICPLDDLPEQLRAESMPLDILRTAWKQGLLLVAIEAGDTPVGFAACAIIGSYLHLLEIDVASLLQRKGIGSLLLSTVIDIATERGLEWVSLTTFSHLPWNAPWYEKKGFTRIISAELPAFLAEILKEEAARGLNPDNRVAMRKMLGYV
ncbi:MAG: GNAT family N-acetyltransferase [Candidatus Cloacimonadota bacterium]